MADRVGFRVALRVWGSTVENLEVALEAHPARAGIDRVRRHSPIVRGLTVYSHCGLSVPQWIWGWRVLGATLRCESLLLIGTGGSSQGPVSARHQLLYDEFRRGGEGA